MWTYTQWEWDFIQSQEKPEDEEEEKKDDVAEKDQVEATEKDGKGQGAKPQGSGGTVAKVKKPESHSIGRPEDDLTLRAAMYGVLFQSYADQVS